MNNNRTDLTRVIIIIIAIMIIPCSYFGYYYAKINLNAFLLTNLSNEQIKVVEREFSIKSSKNIEIQKVYYKNPDYSLSIEISAKDQKKFINSLKYDLVEFNHNEFRSANNNLSVVLKDEHNIIMNKPFPVGNDMSKLIKGNWSFNNYLKLMFS